MGVFVILATPLENEIRANHTFALISYSPYLNSLKRKLFIYLFDNPI